MDSPFPQPDGQARQDPTSPDVWVSQLGDALAAAEWTIEVGPGTLAAVHRSSGATISAALVLRAADHGARLRVLRYEYAVPNGLASDGPPPPISWIETAVNEPAILQRVLDTISEAPAPTEVAPMRLPPELLRRRPRPDDFYAHLAALVRICESRRTPYGPRLSRDNGVSEGTVRSWVHEARRRGLLAPTHRGGGTGRNSEGGSPTSARPAAGTQDS
jgi:acetyl esterase/lipase